MESISRRAFIATMVTGVASCALAIPSVAYADPTSAEVQAQADEVATQLADWQNQLNIALNDYYAALDEHDTAIANMNDAQSRIDAAEAQIDVLQDHLSTRAVTMYKNGSISLVDVLLGATSFEDFTSTWDFLQDMNDSDLGSVTQLKDARTEAQAAHDEYSAQEQIAADKLAEAEEIKDTAEQTTVQYQAELDSLNAEVAQLVEQERQAAEAAAAAAAQASGYTFSGTVPTYDGSRGSAVVQAACTQLGVPYVWGGTSPGVGLDCSGLTQYAYACVGVAIGRTTYTQINAGAIISLADAQEGDLLFNDYSSPGHTGIYIGGNQFIHAPYTGTVVQINSMPAGWVCAVRVP